MLLFKVPIVDCNCYGWANAHTVVFEEFDSVSALAAPRSISIRSSSQVASVPAAKAEDWFGAGALSTVAGKEGEAAPITQREKDKAVMDALWALRDYMNRDSLKLSRYLDNHS